MIVVPCIKKQNHNGLELIVVETVVENIGIANNDG